MKDKKPLSYPSNQCPVVLYYNFRRINVWSPDQRVLSRIDPSYVSQGILGDRRIPFINSSFMASQSSIPNSRSERMKPCQESQMFRTAGVAGQDAAERVSIEDEIDHAILNAFSNLRTNRRNAQKMNEVEEKPTPPVLNSLNIYFPKGSSKERKPYQRMSKK